VFECLFASYKVASSLKKFVFFSYLPTVAVHLLDVIVNLPTVVVKLLTADVKLHSYL
jgi:hypothetical protein